MSEARSAVELPPSAAVPRLLVELPSRPRVFFENLRDLVFPRRLPPLELRSGPAAFWPDVFVKRGLPWDRFLQSGVYHLIAFALLVGFTHLFALRPRAELRATFDPAHQVIFYQPAEYLPPLNTLVAPAARRKADPEFSRQPIISVPREADNHSQTVVTLPRIRLKRDVALPNMVAWSNEITSGEMKTPHLEIPPAPLTPAADITRIAPSLQSSVVTPPPDATRLTQRRSSPVLQRSVVAPPPELRASNAAAAFPGLQPALIAPPPSVDNYSARRLGDLSIAPSAVIAPAPQLPVAAQRTAPGGRLAAGVAPPVVPPPPSVSTSGSAYGSRGRVIALNLHPAVSAPPDLPVGNRRGTFAAAPEGRAGASGSPGSVTGATTGNAGGKENGNNPARKASDLPSGLYVGSATAKPSPVVGDPANKTPDSAANPELMASVRPPRVTSVPSRSAQPESTTKLSEAERSVFANRKFYSLTLSMPNLNSAGGSWVIRFAEFPHESPNHDPNAPADDLSQPKAMRKVDPAYPIQLMRENVAGTVILYAVIHADGSVGNVRILRGVDDRLDRFASEAVAQWKFEPATKNGAPVDVEATFQIPFKPARVGTNF